MLRIKYRCGFSFTCFRIGGQTWQLGGRGQYWRSISLTWPFLNWFQCLIRQNTRIKYKCWFLLTCFRIGGQTRNTLKTTEFKINVAYLSRISWLEVKLEIKNDIFLFMSDLSTFPRGEWYPLHWYAVQGRKLWGSHYFQIDI